MRIIPLFISFIWLAASTWLIFTPAHKARLYLNSIDSSIGLNDSDKTYGDHCSLTLDNIYRHCDIFVIAHSVGWFAKAILFPNYLFLWTNSILFELIEYSFEHQLPNFNECWWDHWIIDVLLTNAIGIYLGMKIFKARFHFDDLNGFVLSILYSFMVFNNLHRCCSVKLMPFT